MISIFFSLQLNAKILVQSTDHRFKGIYQGENLFIFENKATSEKIFTSIEPLQKNKKQFYLTPQDEKNLFTKYGFIFERTPSKIESDTFKLYALGINSFSKNYFYEKIQPYKNNVVKILYSPGTQENDFKSIVSSIKITENNSKFSILSLIEQKVWAGVTNDSPTCAINNSVFTALNEIKNGLEIKCESNQKSEAPPNQNKLFSSVHSCLKGFDVGIIDLIQFIKDTYSYLSQMDQSPESGQPSSTTELIAAATKDPKGFLYTLYSSTYNGLKQSFRGFQGCSLEYQSQKVCETLLLMIPPTKIFKSAIKVSRLKSASQNETKGYSHEADISEIAKKIQNKVDYEVAEASESEWMSAKETLTQKQADESQATLLAKLEKISQEKIEWKTPEQKAEAEEAQSLLIKKLEKLSKEKVEWKTNEKLSEAEVEHLNLNEKSNIEAWESALQKQKEQLQKLELEKEREMLAQRQAELEKEQISQQLKMQKEKELQETRALFEKLQKAYLEKNKS